MSDMLELNTRVELFTENRLVFRNGLPRISKNGSTNVVGVFDCMSSRCRGWQSGKICVVVRVQAPGLFQPIVYSQKCKRCKRSVLPILDEDIFIERVAYRAQRLLNMVVAQPYEGGGKTTPPHDADKCTACLKGIQHT